MRCAHECCALRTPHSHRLHPDHCPECPKNCDRCGNRTWLFERHHHDNQTLCGNCCPICKETQ